MLYVNPTFGRYVEVAAGQPMEEAESDALLQDLYHQCQCLQTFPFRFGLFAHHQTESRAYHEGKAQDSCENCRNCAHTCRRFPRVPVLLYLRLWVNGVLGQQGLHAPSKR